MRKIISALLCALCFGSTVVSGNLYFPPLTGKTWETLSPDSLGWCTDKVPDLYSYLETNNTKAFLLLKDGKIVMEKYFGTFTQDSLWYWASAGKTLTGFTVGIARQEGYLKLTDITSKYLGVGWTACPLAKENKITIWNQLTMTTGLDDGVPDNHCTLDSCLQYKADAGTRWAYHNAPYTLLDSVMKVATGKTINTYITTKIKPQTGITGLFVPLDYDHVYYSTARSMARFGLLLLNKGVWNSTPILTDTAYFRQMTTSSQTLNPSYGYLTWLNGKTSFMLPTTQLKFPGSICPNAPAEMFAAIGKNNQLINVVPSQNLVLIRMGEANENNEVSMLFNDTIWQKLNKVICSSSGINNTSSTKEKFQISPNPANNKLDVIVINEIFDLDLFDLAGNKVYTQASINQETKINTEPFKSGYYILSVRTKSDEVFSKKILIIHER
jgi:CubicO group peptidase (beta-lactamase class C family)